MLAAMTRLQFQRKAVCAARADACSSSSAEGRNRIDVFEAHFCRGSVGGTNVVIACELEQIQTLCGVAPDALLAIRGTAVATDPSDVHNGQVK